MTLTIETGKLGELWLPSCRDEAASLDYMDAACSKAVHKPRFNHLHKARMALRFQHRDTVREITRRGGLLLIGGREWQA